MSADRLRQAASLLRERAEVATLGPWGWRHFGDVTENTCRVVSYEVDPWAVVADDLWHEPDATYIATMAPPVALALADWLDAEADHAERDIAKVKREYGLSIFAGYEGGWFTGHPAIAVVSAILGPTS